MSRQLEPGDILEILTDHLTDADRPQCMPDLLGIDHAPSTCLSCGAKTDPYGNLPCGH